MSDTDLIREHLQQRKHGAWCGSHQEGPCDCPRGVPLAALARVEADMARLTEALNDCSDHHHDYHTVCSVRHPDTWRLWAVSDGEAWVGEDTARRIIADMVCGSPSPGDEELFCALRLGHEGPHAGMTLDGLACEWRRSPKHRAETASTHCRFCGAHPGYWHLPCSDGETGT